MLSFTVLWMHGGIFGVDGKLSVIVAITLVSIGDLANVGIGDTSNLAWMLKHSGLLV